MPILDHWDLKISVDDVLRAQGSDPAVIRARRSKLAQLTEQTIAESSRYLHPIAQYQVYEIENVLHNKLILSGGGFLSGSFVVENLASAKQVAVIGCTVGDLLEITVAEATKTNLLIGLALNGLGGAAVEALGNAVCSHFEQLAHQNNVQATTPLSPGMEGWPVIKGQQQIFGLLDLSQIGIKLNPSGMMQPLKSLTMVIGMGSEVTKTGSPCDFCQVRDRCRYQLERNK